MGFSFEKTSIEDLILINPKKYIDERGWFLECYKKSDFMKNGINSTFNQDNHSYSKYKVLRGLHFQKEPYSQAKLIQCRQGKIIDVAVDFRKNSKTYLKYEKFELSNENNLMLYIPQNFLHGYVAISNFAEVSYKTTQEYNENSQSGIIWNDKTLNIDWGIDFEPILSDKDKNLPTLKEIL